MGSCAGTVTLDTVGVKLGVFGALGTALADIFIPDWPAARAIACTGVVDGRSVGCSTNTAAVAVRLCSNGAGHCARIER